MSDTNGQAPRHSIFQYFQMAADEVSSGFTSLIYPGGRWIHRSGKGMEQFGLQQINDPHLTQIHFYPNSTDIFPVVAIADGISIVLKDLQKKKKGFSYIYHKNGFATSFQMDNPGKNLIPLNPFDGEIVSKVRVFCEKREYNSLNSKVLSRQFFGIESDFVEKNPGLVIPYDEKYLPDYHKEVKLLTNDKAGKAGRARWYLVNQENIPFNREAIGLWKVVVSSANAGGQKRDWQLEILDNHSAFGRSRVALAMFKTKQEAQNFYNYCKSYLIRFLFLMTDEALTSLAKEVPWLGNYTNTNDLIDFSREINSQLYDLVGLSSSEIAYVEKRIYDIDSARGKDVDASPN